MKDKEFKQGRGYSKDQKADIIKRALAMVDASKLISYRTIAKEIGISQSTLSSWLRIEAPDKLSNIGVVYTKSEKKALIAKAIDELNSGTRPTVSSVSKLIGMSASGLASWLLEVDFKRNPVSTASKSEIKEVALQTIVDFIIAGVARNAKAT